jgi:hypothetical protein
MSAATCGNGLIEQGETCETCPQDCEILACTAGLETVTYDINFDAPFGEVPTSVTVLVANRSDVLMIPGSGIGATVVQRIGSRPSGSSLIANDLDYGVRVVLTRAAGFANGRVFTIRFDVCQGETATDEDVACSVEGCSGSFGLIEGCSCSVAIP